MRAVLFSTLAVMSLAACGQPPATPADEAAPAVAEVLAPAPVAVPAMSVEAACRQAALSLYGQGAEAVSFDDAASTLSWPAPVDGGRLIFTCAVNGADVTLTRDGQTQTFTLTSPAAAAQGEAR